MNFCEKRADNGAGTHDNAFVDMFDDDTVLLALKLPESQPHRGALGALIMDWNQVRNLEMLLNYVAQVNPAMLTYNAPLCESLTHLSHALTNVIITKNG